MVNQVAIEQLRDEIKEHSQQCEVNIIHSNFRNTNTIHFHTPNFSLFQEGVTALSSEISEEKEKFQVMMDGKRKEIEAHATEVSKI